MNEFVRFNCSKENNVIAQGQSDIILELITTQNCDNYVIENESHSSFMMYSTQKASSSTESNLQDEIITLSSDTNDVGCYVETNPSMSVSTARPNTNTKLQIRK